MSHEARPISPARFASALEDLPVANLYSKAFEINNSIAHLQRSNEELQAYSDSQPGGDNDCLEAVRENDETIARMRERVQLVKREVERRGGAWHEADVDVGKNHAKQNGQVNGEVDGDEEYPGEAEQETAGSQIGGSRRTDIAGPRPGGRLDDEELRRQLSEQIGEDEDEGMHL